MRIIFSILSSRFLRNSEIWEFPHIHLFQFYLPYHLSNPLLLNYIMWTHAFTIVPTKFYHPSNRCSTKTFSIIQCNYEKHALRVSRVIAVLAKSTCKHAIFLATRVNKRDFTHHENGKYKGTESFDVYSQTKLSLIARVTAWLLAIPDTLFFLPAFPFSDYCLKRRKVQSATDRPKKS